MTDANLCYLSATELGERIAAGDVSSLEATEAYLERIARLDGNLRFLHHRHRRPRPRGRPPRRRRDRGRQPARPAPRCPGRGQGPVRHRRHPDYQRLDDPRREYPRRRRHHHGSAEGSRRCAAGQAQHERVRQRRRLPPSLRSAPQPVGHQPQPRHLQQRFGSGDRRVPVRHLAGRGHWGQHPGARGLLRPRRHPADLGPRQPAWRIRSQLVHGHGRTDLPHRHRLRPHPGRHRRPRSQGPAVVGGSRPGLRSRPGRRHQRPEGRSDIRAGTYRRQRPRGARRRDRRGRRPGRPGRRRIRGVDTADSQFVRNLLRHHQQRRCHAELGHHIDRPAARVGPQQPGAPAHGQHPSRQGRTRNRPACATCSAVRSWPRWTRWTCW